MKVSREDILRKIEACLALGESSNENEAAIALRQAHVLMKKYSLSQDDVVFEKLGRVEIKLKTTIHKGWMLHLNDLIQKAFSVYGLCNPDCKGLVYYGEAIKVELAKYAFESLYNQVSYNRKEYMRKKLWRYKRSNKIMLADDYALGMTSKLGRVVSDFVSADDIKQRDGVMRVVNSTFFGGEPESIEPKKYSRHNDRRSFYEGVNDSANIDLHKGLDNKQDFKEIE